MNATTSLVPSLIDEQLAELEAVSEVHEFAGKTLEGAHNLARRQGFTERPVLRYLKGELTVLRFERFDFVAQPLTRSTEQWSKQ